MEPRSVIKDHLLLCEQVHELLLKLTQSAERQTFSRFTTPPEELGQIHDRLPGSAEDPGEGPEKSEDDPSSQGA